MSTKEKNITFDEYKTVKDEIIKISEERFENLLTKRLNEFRKDFKRELMNELNPRFDAIDAKFSSKFDAMNTRMDSMEKRLGFITWFLPAFLGIMMIILKFVKV